MQRESGTAPQDKKYQTNVAGSAGTDPLQSCYRKQADTQRTLVRVSPRKAAGPDKIPGRVLRDCAGVRADVCAGIFNLSQPGHSS